MGARASLRSGLSYSADVTLEPPSRPLHPVPSQRLNLQTPPTCKFGGWLSNTRALEAHFPTPVAQQTEKKKESSTPRAEKGENTRLFRACAGWRNSYGISLVTNSTAATVLGQEPDLPSKEEPEPSNCMSRSSPRAWSPQLLALCCPSKWLHWLMLT